MFALRSRSSAEAPSGARTAGRFAALATGLALIATIVSAPVSASALGDFTTVPYLSVSVNEAGTVLTADAGVWVPAATVVYEWTDVSGGVLGSAAKLPITEAMRTTTVKVTATASAAGITPQQTTQSTLVSKTFTTIGIPKITGTLLAGKTLTANPGVWGPSGGITYAYFWGNPAKGTFLSSTSTLKLTKADAGQHIEVYITVIKDGYYERFIEAAVDVPKVLTSTATPKISGTAKVGKTLKTSVAIWKPSTVTLSYQWKRNGVAISKATKSSYKLTSKDKGKKVTVAVTGKKSGYASVIKTSAPTKKVRK